MRFSVLFYRSASDACPVGAFLAELKGSDPEEYRDVLQLLKRLEEQRNHREPMTKALEDGILELRYLGKLNTRILWFFRKGQRIILLHAIRNKGQKVRRADMELAQQRRDDWIRRHDNEDQD